MLTSFSEETQGTSQQEQPDDSPDQPAGPPSSQPSTSQRNVEDSEEDEETERETFLFRHNHLHSLQGVVLLFQVEEYVLV